MNKNFALVFVALVLCAATAFAQTEQTSNVQAKNVENNDNSTARIKPLAESPIGDKLTNDKTTDKQTNKQFTENEAANNQASADELPRFEVGAQFTSLTTSGDQAGFGGRFTVNLNRNVALEAEGNFFPRETFTGRTTQGLFGVKIGKRYEKFGVFGKARPGFVRRSAGRYEYFLRPNAVVGDPFPFDFRTRAETSFALDAGGVFEFYPTKKIVTRFDFGDTIIITPARTVQVPSFVNGNTPAIQSFRLSTRTTHNFQFSAGVGFRF